MGRDGALPWHLPEDLKHFRRLTIDKPVIMGRKTYQRSASRCTPAKHRPDARRRISRRESFHRAQRGRSARDRRRFKRNRGYRGRPDFFRVRRPGRYRVRHARSKPRSKADLRYVPPDRPHTQEILGTHAADERNAYAMTFLTVRYTDTGYRRLLERVESIFVAHSGKVQPLRRRRQAGCAAIAREQNVGQRSRIAAPGGALDQRADDRADHAVQKTVGSNLHADHIAGAPHR